MSGHFMLVLCLPLVDSVGMEEQERERRRQVVEKFQKAPFEEIAAHCGARVQQIHCLVLECCHCSEFKNVLSLPGHTTAEQTQSDL